MTTQHTAVTLTAHDTAAAAAAAVLPSLEPLTAGDREAGTAIAPSAFAGAAVCELELAGAPRIAILVGADLVDALATSPLGGLDLAAAAQPALDAAADALGTTARPARSVAPDLAATDIAGPCTAVPLVGSSGPAAVLLLPDALLAGQGPVVGADFADLAGAAAPAPAPLAPRSAPRGIEMLHGVDMEVTVELGRTRMTVRDLLALAPGTVLELDRAAGSPADLLVNGRLIARGEVVVVDEDFGLRVTEIIDESTAG